MSATRLGLLAAAFLALGMGCGSVPPEPSREAPGLRPEAPPPPDPAAFSQVQAWRHLEALAAIGPRRTGSSGARRARSYLREQLEEIGAEVHEVVLPLPPTGAADEPADAVQLIGLLPGDSPDRFMLAASYDTRPIPGIEFVGVNASASGPAVVLELGRALSERPRPYTVMIVLLEGDALPARPGEALRGSRALATRLAETGQLDRIRLAVFYQQVGDLDLSIARDLRSHHIYQEFFWEAAALTGRGIYFPADAGIDSIDAGHVEFIEQGLPRAVLISDPRFGGSDLPGRYAASEEDTLARCSADSLGVVGEVSLSALDRIARRLARIDRFRRSPLSRSWGDPASEQADAAPASKTSAARQPPADSPSAPRQAPVARPRP